jgi:hypothetical protein
MTKLTRFQKNKVSYKEMMKNTTLDDYIEEDIDSNI